MTDLSTKLRKAPGLKSKKNKKRKAGGTQKIIVVVYAALINECLPFLVAVARQPQLNC